MVFYIGGGGAAYSGGESSNGIENGSAEVVVSGGDMLGLSWYLDLFDMLFELPVVDKCIFPFWNELGFQLLRELHHVVAAAVVAEVVVGGWRIDEEEREGGKSWREAGELVEL